MAQTTKAFWNGNSQAVRVPAELAFDRTDIELEIERIGDELRIRPARRPLGGVLEKIRQVCLGLHGRAPGRAGAGVTRGTVMALFVLDTNMCIYLMKNQP